MLTRPFGLMLIGYFAAAVASGQTLPATTQAVAPHVVSVPPGFVVVDVGRLRVLCEAADEPLVRTALAKLKPTTRPSTLPVDLLARVTERRADLTRTMTADLALPDESQVRAFFDDRLIPILKRLESTEHRSPLVYLFTRREVLVGLLKSRTWSDPALYYNRVADDVAFDLVLNINPEREIEQTVLPVLYKTDDDADARVARCVQMIQRTDTELVNNVASSGTLAVYLSFVRFVGDEVVRPLKLKLDQDWLGMGVISNLSAKYAGEVTGVGRNQMLDATTAESPRAPVKADAVDLLHPIGPADLNPRYARPYIDAAGRKATRVVRAWIESTSDASVTKVIVSLRAEPASEGPALVQRIKDLTGVDLASQLGPK